MPETQCKQLTQATQCKQASNPMSARQCKGREDSKKKVMKRIWCFGTYLFLVPLIWDVFGGFQQILGRLTPLLISLHSFNLKLSIQCVLSPILATIETLHQFWWDKEWRKWEEAYTNSGCSMSRKEERRGEGIAHSQICARKSDKVARVEEKRFEMERGERERERGRMRERVQGSARNKKLS